MRICQVVTSVHTGGAERVALLVAAELGRRGHEVTTVSLEEFVDGPLGPAFERACHSFVKIRKAPNVVDPKLPGKLLEFFRAERFSVVHTHNPLSLMYAAIPARMSGSRVVHTKHGPHPDTFKRVMLRRLGALATHAFVAVSQDTIDYAKSIYEVFPWKTHVVTNGTDLTRFRPDPEARRSVRDELGIPQAAVVFGTVGRLAPVKNHALLIRAAAPLLGSERRLVIVGGGQEAEATARVARETGAAEYVHLVGEQSDVARYLSAFDVFVLSSDSEGMPLSLTEAMGVHLPLVATRVGGVPKIIDEGETGLLVPAKDPEALRAALKTLADSPDLRHTMGARGRQVAESRYSVQRMVDDYERLYAS
jgi:glycosyltransferase involved in cell wall biosynthesis